MNHEDIELTALELIKLFRSGAAQIAREFAEVAEERHCDPLSAKAWHDVAEAIERLYVAPRAH